MAEQKRTIVFPSQQIGDIRSKKAGHGTYVEKGKIYSQRLGILSEQHNQIQVTSLKGVYDPIEGEFVIGVVEQSLSSGWLVDIKASSPALLHQNETPWKIQFGETSKYLNHGDAIMAKILSVDEQRKMQITLNDRNLYKIKGGLIINVEPARVPRIIGKKGSMLALIKNYIRVRIFVGQNGRIWIDGETEDIDKVIRVITKIENEAITYGLTNRIETMLKNETKKEGRT